MIEGIRALPWIEEARAKESNGDFLDCDKCMQFNPITMRRHMKCGFIPEAEHRVIPGILLPWVPDGMDELSVCAGYSTALPEVVDAIANFHHYDTGQLRDACDGPPSPVLLQALSLLKGAVLSKDAYRMREQAKKNGGNHGNR